MSQWSVDHSKPSGQQLLCRGHVPQHCAARVFLPQQSVHPLAHRAACITGLAESLSELPHTAPPVPRALNALMSLKQKVA